MKKKYSAPSVQRYSLYQKDGVLTTTSFDIINDDEEIDASGALVKEDYSESSIWDKEW